MTSNDKWSALLDDDWDKPLTTTNKNKTNSTIPNPLQSTTTTAAAAAAERPAAIKYEIKQSYTGSNSMSSYFHQDNKPRVQILTKKNHAENIDDDENLNNKKQVTELSQAEKLAKYNETKRRIFNEGKK